MGAIFVYVTVGSREEALRIGRAAVERRLAACANVFGGMQSIYRWNDEIREDGEAVLILKTVEEQLDALTEQIRGLHKYECPCIVALPITGGNQGFLNWIEAESRG